jgi:opacity protein-like surface antigen
MINKKILTALFLTSALLFSPAFAKTQGNYIGFDVLNTNVEFQFKYLEGTTPDSKKTDSNFGVGLNYKYAFNTNGFFFAPGIFAELNDTYSSIDRTNYFSITEEYRMKNRYGLKFDAGYDVTDNFAMYLTGGASYNSYTYSVFSNLPGGLADTYQSSYELGYLYGAGLKYSLTKKINIGLEYNTQNVDMELKRTQLGNVTDGDYLTSKIQIIKFGISYNF